MRLGYWTWRKIEEGICRQTTWSSGRHGLWVCRGHLLVWGAGIKQWAEGRRVKEKICEIHKSWGQGRPGRLSQIFFWRASNETGVLDLGEQRCCTHFKETELWGIWVTHLAVNLTTILLPLFHSHSKWIIHFLKKEDIFTIHCQNQDTVFSYKIYFIF